MSDPIRTVAGFVKAAKAGERWTDEMVARATGWTDSGKHGSVGVWYDARGRTREDSLYAAAAYATGTDGRLLVEVLDALRKCEAIDWFHTVEYIERGAPGGGHYRLMACDAEDVVIVNVDAPTRNIAACAALLAALKQLKET